jgi:hypothetical protein
MGLLPGGSDLLQPPGQAASLQQQGKIMAGDKTEKEEMRERDCLDG